MSLRELNEFLTNQEPQRATLNCWGTITDMYGERGWYYIACKACCRKIHHTDSPLICNYCKNSQAEGVIRFRVEVQVSDGEDEAVFVLFDRDVNHITGWTATDVMDAVGGPQANIGIPDELLLPLGLTYHFEIKITEHNFKIPRQPLVVSRVLN